MGLGARTAVAGLATCLLLLAGCTSDPDTDPGVDDSTLDIAVSEPVEDSVYPGIGDPGLDALHYDLDLHWDPKTRTLEAIETLAFRAARSDDTFQLDFSAALKATSVTLDGQKTPFAQVGKNLVVEHPLTRDDRHLLEVRYAGTPKPAAAPTTRSDFSTTGFTITPEGRAWTMQEPYGAYTWYAVNDQPADKALYDFTITVPSPWVGIANGELESRTGHDGLTTTRWHLAEPAASYLVTLAVGDYTMTRDRSGSGVPITYWVPRDQASLVRNLRAAAAGLDWLEGRLGPYPFDSLGFVLVDSQSGMETQTMITLGITDYTTSTAVLVHEMAHQWYGDQVTPNDWRDVWMNEGMAMYLQGLYQAEEEEFVPVETVMDHWATFEPRLRKESGPPADYDPARFGASNVYYGPALMYDELRKRIGNRDFYQLVRDWPAANENGSVDREDFLPWIEEQTGLELDAFFDAWLLGTTSPPRT